MSSESTMSLAPQFAPAALPASSPAPAFASAPTIPALETAIKRTIFANYVQQAFNQTAPDDLVGMLHRLFSRKQKVFTHLAEWAAGQIGRGHPAEEVVNSLAFYALVLPQFVGKNLNQPIRRPPTASLAEPRAAVSGHYLTVPTLTEDETPYSELAAAAFTSRVGDVLVDVGAFMGHSTCYLMECLAHYGSPAVLYAIDPFGQYVEPRHGENRNGTLSWGESLEDWGKRMGDPTALYDAFRFYTAQSPARDRLYDHAQFPSTCGGEFKGWNVQFVYLHHSQTHAGILRDLQDWWAVLQPGGKLVVNGKEAMGAVADFCGLGAPAKVRDVNGTAAELTKANLS